MQIKRNKKGQFIKGSPSVWKGKKRIGMKHDKQFKKGQTPWNKGKKNPNSWWKGKKHTKESRAKMSISQKGNKNSLKYRKGNKHNLGRKLTKETKEKIRLANSGKNNWNWKGGTTPESQKRLKTEGWDLLRKQALRRDLYCCQSCGIKTKLDVHHKRPWRHIKKDELDNLVSLCRKCHMRAERLLVKE